MKKILAFSALLLVAFTCDAAAGTETTLVLDGQCGFFGVEMGPGTAKPGIAIIRQSGSGCSGSQYGVGVSVAALTAHFGRAWVFSVHDTATPGTTYLYEFSYPLFGGTWQAFATTDGKTFVNAGSGAYHTTK